MANYTLTFFLSLNIYILVLVLINNYNGVISSSPTRSSSSSSSAAADHDNSIIIPLRNQDIVVAIEEMERANYFTFVMLLNMAPPDLIQGNVTFLMPKDRTLAKTIIPENAVIDFLLGHSIPSPLLFDHLQHIPSASMLPTSRPEFMLTVTNNGRHRFFLNNVRIISPNICTRGSSIRCHGIDGVVQPTFMPPSSCPPNLSATIPPLTPPLPSPSPSPSPTILLAPPPPPLLDTTAAPPADSDVSQQKSGSQRMHYARVFKTMITTCLMLI